MAMNPSPFGTADNLGNTIEWDDGATVHKTEAGKEGGIISGFSVLHRGSFAEMVRLVSLLPADRRSGYYIEKAGDRRFSLEEILALASRDDFPLKRAV